jgi:hypothetical protein
MHSYQSILFGCLPPLMQKEMNSTKFINNNNNNNNNNKELLFVFINS